MPSQACIYQPPLWWIPQSQTQLLGGPDADRLKQALCIRGYDPQGIQTALDKARAQDRTQLLSKGIPTDNSPLVSDEDTSDEVEPASVTRPSFLVLTHHPENQVFRAILSNHWDLLGASDTTRCLFDAGFKISSRRNCRLQDILVHSSIPLPHKRGKQGKRINECPKTTCIYCDNMDKTSHIYSYTTKQSDESQFNICCQSSNLVYCLQCNRCGKQYVGQTKRKLLKRLGVHFNNIRKKTSKWPHWPSFQHHWTLRWYQASNNLHTCFRHAARWYKWCTPNAPQICKTLDL